LATARRFLEFCSPVFATTPNVAEKYSSIQQRQRVPPTAESQVIDRCVSIETESSLTEHKQNSLQRIRGRIVSIQQSFLINNLHFIHL